MSFLDWPDLPREQELYAALLSGDPLAPARIAVEFTDLLTDFLVRRFPRVDLHLCREASDDALLKYLMNPLKFDPSLGRLGYYLRMSAEKKLLNALKTETRRASRKVDFDVELLAETRNSSEEDDALDWNHPRLQQCLAELDETDRAIVELIRDGERSTEVFAELLGCENLSTEEQEKTVKRAKDRIKKRLQRRVADE